MNREQWTTIYRHASFETKNGNETCHGRDNIHFLYRSKEEDCLQKMILGKISHKLHCDWSRFISVGKCRNNFAGLRRKVCDTMVICERKMFRSLFPNSLARHLGESITSSTTIVQLSMFQMYFQMNSPVRVRISNNERLENNCLFS